MDILGLIGQQYMFLLLVVLFLGFGLGTWAIIKALFSNEGAKGATKAAQVTTNSSNRKNIITSSKINKLIGGINMNNGWLKLGAFSLVGLIISIAILGFISSSNRYNMNMSNGMNTHGTSAMPVNNGMNMQGGMNMNGMSGQSMSNYYDMNIQNQLNQMQMQLNQMQMQMQNMTNTNSSSGSGSMSMPMM